MSCDVHQIPVTASKYGTVRVYLTRSRRLEIPYAILWELIFAIEVLVSYIVNPRGGGEEMESKRIVAVYNTNTIVMDVLDYF